MLVVDQSTMLEDHAFDGFRLLCGYTKCMPSCSKIKRNFAKKMYCSRSQYFEHINLLLLMLLM